MKKPSKKDVAFLAIIVVLVAAVATFSALWGVAYQKEKESEVYYNQKCAAFRLDNKHLSQGQIVFIGDSITDYYPLDDFYADLSLSVYNRGIGGDTTSGLLKRLDLSLFALKPTKVSLLIGINDIDTDVPNETLLANYKKILDEIKANLPQAEVFCLSILPVNEDIARYKINCERTTQRVPVVNSAIQTLAEARGYHFVNLYPLFEDGSHHLVKEYAAGDGLHLSHAGYEVWSAAFKPMLQ